MKDMKECELPKLPRDENEEGVHEIEDFREEKYDGYPLEPRLRWVRKAEVVEINAPKVQSHPRTHDNLNDVVHDFKIPYTLLSEFIILTDANAVVKKIHEQANCDIGQANGNCAARIRYPLIFGVKQDLRALRC